MKKIFSKTIFPKTPDGDRYEWKEVETTFSITKTSLFAIKIDASAKNASQNYSKDDDDLRIVLDDFDFGKYERHQETISWKGFGTSASWDGASLKGGTKTIYFFVELETGLHTLQFFADGTPILKNIEIFEIENNTFELKNLKPLEKIKSEHKGIPWLSFIFLGAHTKSLTLLASVKSAKNKGSTDGDNLKVIINGKILQNPTALRSYRYKNFYFSGNIKEFDVLSISHEDLSDPLAFENSIELWYDEEPEILSLSINYFDNKGFLERFKEIFDLKEYILSRAKGAISYFKRTNKPYSAKFLKHALKTNPPALVFNSKHLFVKKIKADPVYKKILNILKEKLVKGDFDGEIWPGEIPGEIIFDAPDLETSVHGISKIEYNAQQVKQNVFQVEMILFDIYDFQKINLPSPFTHFIKYAKGTVNNTLDIGEAVEVIHGYEIEIHTIETISI